MGININSTVAELAGLYDSVNERCSNDTCSTNVYQVYRQKEYRDAYEKLKSINIENIALTVLSNSTNEKVLSRLRILIQDNIRIYESRQEDFKNVDFEKLYPLWEDNLFGNKRAILLKDKETIKDYPYPTEREREMLLKENQQDINELDNERYELRRADASWIGKNYYLPIYELSLSFAKILDSYFPVEKEKEQKEIRPAIRPGAYFDMKLISLIHHQCNNIQFENITEVDLYAVLNLQSTNGRLILKTGERTRMCYLIHKLYEYLKTDNRSEWRTAMLKALDIKEDFYKSKYKEPASELPSRRSETFAQRIDGIFE